MKSATGIPGVRAGCGSGGCAGRTGRSGGRGKIDGVGGGLGRRERGICDLSRLVGVELCLLFRFQQE